VIIAGDYDDTKNHKLFIRIFHYFCCSIQTSITSVRNKILWYCKSILKQMQCRIWFNKKAKKDKWWVWAPVSQVTGFEPLCHMWQVLSLCVTFASHCLHRKVLWLIYMSISVGSFFPACCRVLIEPVADCTFSFLVRLRLCHSSEHRSDVNKSTSITVTLPGCKIPLDAEDR